MFTYFRPRLYEVRILFIQINNYIRPLAFRGTSETINCCAYEPDYDQTLGENEYKMPYKSIYLSDSSKPIEELKEVTDIPMQEFLNDNINTLIKKSSHYTHNSSIEYVKSLPAKKEIVIQKIKNTKVHKENGKVAYSGKIYFSDMDELPNTAIRNEHNIIIHDKRPDFLNYEDLRNRYIDEYSKNNYKYDKELRNQKSLKAIIDYYSRKIDTKSTDKAEIILEYQTNVKHAQHILKLITKLDKELKIANESKNIDKEKFNTYFDKLRCYYKKKIPNSIKAAYTTTRYL